MNGILGLVPLHVRLLLFLALIPALEAAWIRVASPKFEIFTDTNERSARRVLTRFEQASRVLSAGPWKHSGESKTRILLFSSEREYALLRPAANTPGFYQSGPERDYIAMLAGAEVDRVILHEYTHSVLNHSLAPLPQWLEEGLAEFYSTLAIGQTRATAGAPIPSHAAALEREKWLTAAQLAAVDRKSPSYNEADKTGIFYSESWALTHMLNFGEAYRGKLVNFVDALGSGVSAPHAFERAFGMTPDAAVAALPAYIRAGFRTVEVALPAADDIQFTAATLLDPAEAQQSRGEILLLMGRDREAENLYENLARRYPNTPSAQTGLAVIAMRNRDYNRARSGFEKALELGARDSETYFEYAMLLRDTGAAPGLVNGFLEKTVAANPAHAEAHFLLGIRASDGEKYSEAVEHLRRATEILPRQAYFWQALSYAEYKLRHVPEGRLAALRALRSASTEHETEMARNALKLFDEPDEGKPGRRAGAVTPGSWTAREGDRAVSGDLIEVDCEAQPVTLHVRTASGTLTLKVANPRAVTVRGQSGQRSLICGVQSPAPVRVQFDDATREVTALEFR